MSIIQSKQNYETFLKENYIENTDRRKLFINFFEKYYSNVINHIQIGVVRGNGCCLINAFLAHLEMRGLMNIIKLKLNMKVFII